ncbi:MAG: MarR family transcriptional regulator [Pyrinomonadaceae bacterium]|nr:MarR family transcriptional regulator [Pyrinomonadaceae bacterium]
MPLQFLSPIHKASRQISIYLERATIELGVSPAEGHLLSYLKTYAPCPLSELERVFGHKRSTLTSMLDRLSDRALLTRHVNPEDRRSFTLELTPDGRKLAGKLQKLLEAFELSVEERINDKQLAGFRAVMEAIADVTDVKVREREI